MTTIEPTMATPLKVDETGTIRVGGTRVLVDVVVQAYREGSSAEEVVLQYPALTLQQVYATLSYYLAHRDELDAYVRERMEAGERLRAELATAHPERVQIRERLQGRIKGKRP